MSGRVDNRLRRAAEKIQGNESLTAELDDQAAQALLAWALQAARTIAWRTDGLDDLEAEQILNVRLRALRGLMRTVSAWTAEGPGVDPAQDEARWLALQQAAQIVYGPDYTPAQPELCRPQTLVVSSGGSEGDVAFIRALQTAVEPPRPSQA
jgi:hypothetical protein